MLKLPTKAATKVILIAPALLGIYLAVMYPLHGVILTIISSRLGVSITNEYPLWTAFLLYVASILLAVVLNRLLLKRSQSYDEKLIAGLVSNVAFNFTIVLISSFNSGGIVTSLIVLLVLSFSGFFIAAPVIVLIDNIENRYFKSKLN